MDILIHHFDNYGVGYGTNPFTKRWWNQVTSWTYMDYMLDYKLEEILWVHHNIWPAHMYAYYGA
jgi:hypothetical protein